jgi:hypothetical protein
LPIIILFPCIMCMASGLLCMFTMNSVINSGLLTMASKLQLDFEFSRIVSVCFFGCNCLMLINQLPKNN